MSHCILVSHGSHGDVLPFIRIGEVLKRRGHKVSLVSHHIYEKEAAEAGINFAAMEFPEEYGEMIEDIPMDADLVSNSDQVADYYRKYHCSGKLTYEYALIQSLVDKKDDTVLIVRNASSAAAVLAAEILEIPIASVVLAPSFISRMGFDNKVLGPYILKEVNEFRHIMGLEEVPDWLSWISSPKRVFGTWPKWFASDDPMWHIPVKPLGFPIARGGKKQELPGDIIEYLENEEPVCITGGTGKYIDSQFFINCIEACRRVGKKALIVTRKTELLPKDIGDDVKVVDHLPFETALPYMALLIHHGGIGTLSEAYAAGIPQLILPKEMDRPDNAARVKKSGAGDFLPPIAWNPELISGTLERLLTPEVKKIAELYRDKVRARFSFEAIASYIEDMAGNHKFKVVWDDFKIKNHGTVKNTGEGNATQRKKALLAQLLLKKRGHSK